ncbi:glycosyltransferase family 4 protein [Amycolatopsis sp. FU40]|uniref:glycosyltransferase family 4 protein n=1 Tax=Amycolatopsis sp. FU40 TaxID=2914159 RepID=UPI001F34EF98|nr:glycosyltransferase family 4 protein [Amycolatopsis sp. FU40]UKD57194.1 glycosyltransferase family 4 protein [Amycolatopsis sp. FU40]
MTPSPPLRILLVSHYYPPHVGGIENVAAQQARMLAARGAEVTVLTSALPAAPPSAVDGVHVVRVPAWNGTENRAGVPFPVSGPRLSRAVREWVRWADVVHVHDTLYQSSWAAGLRAARTGKPLFLTQHVAVVEHPSALVRGVQHAVYGSIGRRLFRASHEVFVVNDAVAAFVRRFRGGGAELLPNGVDTSRYRPAPAGEIQRLRERWGLPARRVLVLFVGRPAPKKGYDLLLAARHPGYDLVFAGERPKHLPADPSIHHLGALSPDEISGLYRACDVFALPSTAEGFPLTVQEAMASGLPVVTTDDPGYASYGLDRTQVALLPRDPETLRATLRSLAADPARRAAMGRYSAGFAAARFSWPKHAQRLEESYRAALGTAEAPA